MATPEEKAQAAIEEAVSNFDAATPNLKMGESDMDALYAIIEAVREAEAAKWQERERVNRDALIKIYAALQKTNLAESEVAQTVRNLIATTESEES